MPASAMGEVPFLRMAILDGSLSTAITRWDSSAKATAVDRPTYPEPMTVSLLTQMSLIGN
jgi:hypothetical protein